MPHELPKAYEPGAIETRWAEYWVNEKLFSVPTPPPGEDAAGVHAAAAASERDRAPAHGPHAQPDADGHHRALASHARISHAVAARHRPRRHRYADDGGAAAARREGKKRRDLGREEFIERVWEWKQHYGGAILDQMKRLGASVDWDREYFTMDENLSRAVREVFVRLYEEGLIYRGKYIVNWCPRLRDGDFRSRGQARRGRRASCTRFAIRWLGTKEFITVATTRPETMLGDTAVAVNAKDERYTHLHGKKVLLPLMNREIPIITDELAQSRVRHRRGEGDAGARSQRLSGRACATTCRRST